MAGDEGTERNRENGVRRSMLQLRMRLCLCSSRYTLSICDKLVTRTTYKRILTSRVPLVLAWKGFEGEDGSPLPCSKCASLGVDNTDLKASDFKHPQAVNVGRPNERNGCLRCNGIDCRECTRKERQGDALGRQSERTVLYEN